MLSIFNIVIFLVVTSYANAYKDPLVTNKTLSRRSVMIHLFEWKWTDIANECERFLGPKGYAAVQVSPPNEHVLAVNQNRSWRQRYLPVSYKLISRSGNEKQFKDMVNRCNAVGVRIYVDAVINHMAESTMSGIGFGGSVYNAAIRSFEGVPYSSFDFNDGKCKNPSGLIQNYNDINQVRDCRLENRVDLASASEYVRNKTSEYLNYLIDIGVAGFRIDAAKHMWPGDIQAILNKLKYVRQDIFGPNKKPFIYQEVIDRGTEPIKYTEYTSLGRVTEFQYGAKLSEVVMKKNNQRMAFLKNFGTGWGFMPDEDSLAFVDNHLNQRGYGGGIPVLTFHEARLYKIANAFMMAWPYAYIQIMSSYRFEKNQVDQGPPTNGEGYIKNVLINDDDTCDNDWICEHRWRQIYNMAMFRNVVGFEKVENWWDNGGNQIAFSRGESGFIAINNENFEMNVAIITSMAPGDYCDIISGNKKNGSCTGKIITIRSNGTIQVKIGNNEEDPVIAIHKESKII